MRVLYINNFRGFQHTLIPIQKVNFLVGENSTGKTSILKLIKVLSDQTFKFSLDFSSPVVDLGRFEDIINKTDSSGKFFEIGMLAELGDRDTNGLYGPLDPRPHFLKLSYREFDEKMLLNEVKLHTPFYEVLIIYKDGTYQYVYKIHKEVEIIDEKLKVQIFKDWCTNSSPLSKRKILKKVQVESFYRNNTRFTFMDIFGIIGDSIQKLTETESRGQAHWRSYAFFSIIENFFPDIRWIAPIRAEPKRIYEHMETKESIDGSHAPQVLRDILLGTNKKSLANFKVFLDKFGKNSGLFDEIKIKKFGNEKFAPFEIQVILEGLPYSISNVGYGVSQVLPLLLEVFDKNNKWLTIQQPEVHLHPRAQAEFGELLFNSVLETDKCFFIETHSDFTLDRFRFCVSIHDEKFDSQVLFFNRKNKLNTLEIIPIAEDGSYWESASPEFREFFLNESIKLLGI